MPPDVARRLNAAINKALTQPDTQERFRLLGMQSAPNTLENQDAFVRAQLAAWRKRMAHAKIQPE